MENFEFLIDVGISPKSFIDQSISTVSEREARSYRPPWPTTGINEKFVRCLWVDQLFLQSGIETVEGERLEILSPGWWNLEGGPDFRHGKIIFQGQDNKTESRRMKVGDIEVHTLASSWKAHGHNKDKFYDTVILHVFLWNDTHGEAAINSIGRQVPQLELQPFLTLSLDVLKEKIRQYEYPFKNPGSAGDCSRILKSLSAEKLGTIWDKIGDRRFLLKSVRFGDRLWEIERENPGEEITPAREQFLYSHIMEAMGIKNNRWQFSRLANLLDAISIKKMLSLFPARKRARILEAALMAASGFLSVWGTAVNLDRASKLYLKRLQSDWLLSQKYFQANITFSRGIDKALSPVALLREEWQYRGMRPANYPARRMAGMRHFVINCLKKGIFSSIQEILMSMEASPVRVTAAMGEIFKPKTSSYWDYRYVFNGKKSSGRVALIGKDRVAITLINVILPVFFAWAWLNWDVNAGRKIYQLWCKFPAQGMYSLNRFMLARLLGDEKTKWRTVHSARRQQALIEIYQRYCRHEEKSCEDCEFLKADWA